MSVRASDWVWRHSASRGTARLVLLAIADQYNDEHDQCFPGVAYLAEKCRIGERTVQDALRALEQSGELVRQYRRGRSTVYRMSFTPADSAPPGVQIPHPAKSAPPQISHPGVRDAAPPPPQISHPGVRDAAPITVTQPPTEPLPEPRRAEIVVIAAAPQPTGNPAQTPDDPVTPDANVSPQPTTAQTLVATWLDHCRARPPANVIGQVARHCAALLAEGIDPHAVEAGLAAWHAKGLHPATLPSVVNEVLNPPRPQPNRRRVSPGDQALALIADMRERGIQ